MALSTSSAESSSTTDTAAAAATLSFSSRLKIYTEPTSVLNGRLPEIRTTEPNSPTARANDSAVPGEDRRRERGQHDPPEHGERSGAE